MTEPKTDAGKALKAAAYETFLASLERDNPLETALDNYVEVLGLTWDEAALRAAGEWVMVPTEPTKEMLAAAGFLSEDEANRRRWTLMTNAAPKPEDKA